MQASVEKNPCWDDRPGPAGEVRLGAFRYLPDQSILLRDGERVHIGSRALSLLKVLTAHVGHFVPNDMLIAAAWPNTHVDDTNQPQGTDDCVTALAERR
jgi:DNA-binding winged helix-turn-helix (wHTH) protein